MITNDTTFFLTALKGHDAEEIATAFLVILILVVAVWKTKQNFNKYIKSRLQHMEQKSAEKQNQKSLIAKCEERITKLEDKHNSDIDQSNLYIQTLQEYIESLNSQIEQINQKLDSTNRELRTQKDESNHTKINELRDRLLQSYRYYTSPKTNPSFSWNEMEAEAFWAMFEDYEKRGGNGYMHTDVEPAMRRLTITNLFYNPQ